jgi:hypothetical protein
MAKWPGFQVALTSAVVQPDGGGQNPVAHLSWTRFGLVAVQLQQLEPHQQDLLGYRGGRPDCIDREGIGEG